MKAKGYILYDSNYMTFWKKKLEIVKWSVVSYQELGRGKAWRGRAQRIWGGALKNTPNDTLRMDTCHYIHLSKPIEGTTQQRTLMETMVFGWVWRYSCKFLIGNTCTTVVAVVDNNMWGPRWRGGYGKSLYLPSVLLWNYNYWKRIKTTWISKQTKRNQGSRCTK